MKPIAAVVPLQFVVPHLTIAINRARLLGRLRQALPSSKPSRIKAKRLKARLSGALGY